MNIRSHFWYIKITYISWSGSLSSQDWEYMKLEVARLIIQVTVHYDFVHYGYFMEGSNDIIRILRYFLLISPRIQLYLYSGIKYN